MQFLLGFRGAEHAGPEPLAPSARWLVPAQQPHTLYTRRSKVYAGLPKPGHPGLEPVLFGLQGEHLRPLPGLCNNDPGTDPAAAHVSPDPGTWRLWRQVAMLWNCILCILDFDIV